MASFNPTQYKESTGGSNKMFSPGQLYARIANIALESPSWDKKGGTYVNVTLEGPALGDGFEGFQIDKNDPGLGNYVGSVCTVRSGNFTFSDFTYQDKFIDKDSQIGQFLEDLTKQMGKLPALQEEYLRLQAASTDPENFDISSVDDYLELVKSVVIDPDNFGQFAVQGEPYTNSNGNTAYSFRFPKKDKAKYPFAAAASAEETPESLLVLDTYIVPKYVKPGTEAAPVATATAAPATETAKEVAAFGGQTAPTATVNPTAASGVNNPELDELPF